MRLELKIEGARVESGTGNHDDAAGEGQENEINEPSRLA
jgi:hypothetical protein